MATLVKLRRHISKCLTVPYLKRVTLWQSYGIPITTKAQVCRMYSTSGDRPCSRYPVPDLQTLDADMRDMITEIAQKSGFVPNVFSALSHRPEEFRAFFTYYDTLMGGERGSLTKAEKELIVVATSAVNHCLYCVVSHSALHRIFSKNTMVADQVATCPEHADLTPRERAIVDFAMKVCKMEVLTEEDFIALEPHGVSREDAWDVGAIAAFFALSNRMANLTAMLPNEEFHLMGRVKKEKK